MCLGTLAQASENRFFSGVQTFSDLLLPRSTQVTVGVGPSYGPDYFGSDDYEFAPELVFNLRFKDFLTFNNDGASINLLGEGLLGLSDFEFGPTLRIQAGRGDNANPDIEGLGDINGSPDLGLYAQVRIKERFVLQARYTHAFLNRGNGGRFDVRVSTLLYQKDHFSIAADGMVNWITKGRARTFFGVTGAQSEAAGLRPFDTRSSFQDMSAGVASRWEFKDKWALNTYARYSRIFGRIDNSPIIQDVGSPNQFIVGIHVARTFEFNRKPREK